MSLANRTIDLASKQVLVAADGTAAAPSITNDGDTNTGMFFPAADTIAFSEGGTESMRIDSSGRVGIGTTQMTSSGADLHIFRASGATVRLDRTGAGTCTIQSAETGVSLRDLTLDANTLLLNTANTERLRIDSSGNVGIGVTPSAWLSTARALQVDNIALAQRYATETYVGHNFYYNSANTLTYKSSDFGARIGFYQGVILFENAPSGTAGNSATFTERLRIDSSGRVGIGMTPAALLDISKSDNSGGVTDFPALRLTNTNSTQGNGTSTYNYARIDIKSGNGTVFGDFGTRYDSLYSGAYIGTESSHPVLFQTGGIERLRITSGGDLLVGTTTSNGKTTILGGSDVPVMSAQATNASYSSNVLSLFADRNTSNSSYNFLVCTRTGVAVVFALRDSGNVVNTNNSYGAISDIKLKENIENASSQWNDIKSIQVRKFSFKNDEEHKRMLGLVAQEVELISPHLVETVIDRDKDGNDLGTTTKEVKYSVLYMKAVKALQEAMERIEQLETNNTALESRIAALEAA